MSITKHLLYSIVKEIWEKETLPSDWKKGLIIAKILKIGNVTNCNTGQETPSYLMPNKILSNYLNKIVEKINRHIRNEQVGF
jgi:hypothetical protein